MSRTLPLLLAAATGLLAAAPVAQSATNEPLRVGLDQARQVSFRLEGRSVTVTLRPVDGAANPLVTQLGGTEVVLACNGRSPKGGALRTANLKAPWPVGATSLAVRLPRDVSRTPKWCLMEEPGGADIAVTFKLRIPNPAKPAA